jgi:hypothetical protein
MMVVVSLVLAHHALRFRTRPIISVNRDVGIPMVGRSRRANANNYSLAICLPRVATLLELPIVATLIMEWNPEHGYR